MPIELLISPPASGKTETCIQRILAFRKVNPLDRVWVIVPDRQAVAYFRQRLAQSGGALGVSIGTFRDLYVDILESTGQFIPVITPALEHRLVQQTILDLSPELTHFASIKGKPGFILTLQDCFAELRGALVRSESFLAYTQTSTPANHELALLYDHTLKQLARLGWIDPEGQSWLAIDALQGDSRGATDIGLVVVDGFTSFMGARRQFLKTLSAHVADILITLPGKPASTRTVNNKTQKVCQDLRDTFDFQVNELNEEPHLAGAAAYLERHVFTQEGLPRIKPDEPFMLEVRSQAEEAREALRWIKALNKRQGVPLYSCALYASNLATYQPLIQAAANEFGIKVYFSKPAPLSESPAILSILSLLNLPLEDFPNRSLFNTLHSPYFDFAMDADTLEDLERISQKTLIVKGRDQWQETWQVLENTSRSPTDDLDEERYREDPTRSMNIPALHAAMENFWTLFNCIDNPRSQTAWIAWLEGMLEELNFYQNITLERDQDACQSFSDALKALVLSESVLGERIEDYPAFILALQGTLNGNRVDEPRHARKDALIVAGMIEARALRFKAVALLGFSEGLFPVVENPDPFLDETLRCDLGMEPRLGREQPSIFYQALTRTDQYLLITRPYLSEDGETWEPSPYWNSVCSLYTEKPYEPFEKISAGSVRLQSEAASSHELLFWAVQQGALAMKNDADLLTRWQAVNDAGRILDVRRAKKAHGIYEGNIEQLVPQLAVMFSPSEVISASRLETYGTCPYKFFVDNLLKLSPKEPPELGLDAAQKGTIFHRILEQVYRDVQRSEGAESALDLLDFIATAVFHDAPRREGFRPSPLWEIEKAQYIQTLRKTIEQLDANSAGWTPIAFEQQFGTAGLPPVVIIIGDEEVQLRGIIDRVDRHSNGDIRVIDYKTGGGSLEKADLERGYRLQLPIYGMVAQYAMKLGQVVDGFYWKINAASPSALKLSTFKHLGSEGPEAAYDLALDHIKKFLSSMRKGEFAPKVPKGGCPFYCPAVAWCWRYQAGFKP